MVNNILAILDSYPTVHSSSGDFRFTATTAHEPPASIWEIEDWEKALSCRAGLMNDFWGVTRSARIYYAKGSSGLTMLSPEGSIRASLLDHEIDEDGRHKGDIVIGTFEVVPDSIVYSPAENMILWAGGIDGRDDWDRFESIASFLGEYKNYPYL